MLVPFGSSDIQVPKPGDWRCMGCNDLQLAKNPTCRKCGERKPESSVLQEALAATTESALVALTPAQSPIIAQMCQGEDWSCPLCKEISFSNRTTCRRCGCPRPEGPTVVQTVEHQLATGGYIGYLPDVNKIEAQSSWSKQWDQGPPPGVWTMGAMTQAPTPFDPNATYESSSSTTDSSSSSSSDSDDSDAVDEKVKTKVESKKLKSGKKEGASSSSSSGSSSDEPARKKKKVEAAEAKEAKHKAKVVAKETKKEAKVEAKKGGTKDGTAKKDDKAKAQSKQEKKKKKAMSVEEEVEKRRQQQERRKNRIVSLA